MASRWVAVIPFCVNPFAGLEHLGSSRSDGSRKKHGGSGSFEDSDSQTDLKSCQACRSLPPPQGTTISCESGEGSICGEGNIVRESDREREKKRGRRGKKRREKRRKQKGRSRSRRRNPGPQSHSAQPRRPGQAAAQPASPPASPPAHLQRSRKHVLCSFGLQKQTSFSDIHEGPGPRF